MSYDLVKHTQYFNGVYIDHRKKRQHNLVSRGLNVAAYSATDLFGGFELNELNPCFM